MNQLNNMYYQIIRYICQRNYNWNSTYLSVLSVNTNRNTLPPLPAQWGFPICQNVSNARKCGHLVLSVNQIEIETGIPTLWFKLRRKEKKSSWMKVEKERKLKPLRRLPIDCFAQNLKGLIRQYGWPKACIGFHPSCGLSLFLTTYFQQYTAVATICFYSQYLG